MAGPRSTSRDPKPIKPKRMLDDLSFFRRLDAVHNLAEAHAALKKLDQLLRVTTTALRHNGTTVSKSSQVSFLARLFPANPVPAHMFGPHATTTRTLLYTLLHSCTNPVVFIFVR